MACHKTKKTMEQNVGYQQPAKQGNPMGITGFVLAIIGFVLGWIPILNWIGWLLWLLGLIFSIIGVFKTPKGLAIAGIVISVLFLILEFWVAPAIWSSAAESILESAM